MTEYHYIDAAQKQCGPFSLVGLQSETITPETFVWCAGLPDWTKAKDVTELKFLFDKGGVASEVKAAPMVISTPIPQQPIIEPQVQQSVQQQQFAQNQETPSRMFSQQHYGQNQKPPMPKTWMLEAILMTVLCCVPLGIVAILSANKVESRYYLGDFEGAEAASNEAKKWLKWGLIISAISFVCIMLFYICMFVFAASAGMN